MAGNTVFQLRRSSVAGKVPTTSTLNIGELALNLTDQKLYSTDGTLVFETGANLFSLSVNSAITIGNSVSNATVNSTIYTGKANNAAYLNGVPASAYVNTSGNFTLSGVITHTANVYVNGAIIANGGVGTSGQVLTSSAGGNVYWSTVSSGGGGFTNGQSISVNNFVVTGNVTAAGSNGTSGQVLTSTGTGVYWATPSGGSGTGIAVTRQQYTGDGSTTVFTVTGGYTPNQISVFLNGSMLRNGTEVTVTNGSTFTLASAPPVGALIDVVGEAAYFANGISTTTSQQFTANGTANSFTISGGYVPNSIQVYLNGVKQIPGTDVVISSGNTVNFIVTPSNNYIVDVFGFQSTVLQTSTVRQFATGNGTANSFTISGGYLPNQLDVYMNGVKLLPSVANVTTGVSVSFTTPPPNGAELQFTGLVPINYTSINTSASYVWSNTQTFANLYMVSTAGINANGSYGSNGQILTSNGTSVYWSSLATKIDQVFTGTGACTTFTVTGGYVPNQLDVYLTGVKQIPGTDVTISSGSNIVFPIAPAAGETIEVVGYTPASYSYANTSAQYSWSNTQTFSNLVFTSSAGISANGSYGSNGQVLASNGTSVYWSNIYSTRYSFVGDGTTSTFSIPGGYIAGQLDVYLNGVKLHTADVDVSSGSNIVFVVPPINGAKIDIVGFTQAALSSVALASSYQYNFSNTITFSNTVTHTAAILANTVNATSYTIGTAFTANSTITNTASLVVSTNTATIGTGTYFVSNGNVGIGNNAPAHKLSVYSGSTAATTYNNASITGGSTCNMQGQSTSVSTSATVILNSGQYASFCLVYGSDGTNRFMDVVLFGLGTGTVNVISSLAVAGTPASRTYSQSSSTYRLAMGSGTYTVQVTAFTMNG